MRRPPPWPLLASETLHDCAVFTVERALVRSPRSGEAHPFFRIGADPWVNVVPRTADGLLVMVRQFRHGSRRVTLEIPGGIVDPGETPEEAGARELLEETGYRPARLRPLGAVNPNPALFGNVVHTFLAEDVERVGEVRNTGLEETWVELVPEAEIPERLRGGEIDHALVVAAFHWWALDRLREEER
jgi:8-oxo-dGTP pyrophosphatase MutT (NUDIX family)